MRQSVAALLTAAAVVVLASAAAAQSTRPGSCTSAEHRQFDFWVGDWDAYQMGKRDSVVARLRVDLILDGCVLREVYEGRNGLVGQSFSSYDASRRVWHQSWVTNRGQLLVLEGRIKDESMVLSGAYPGAPGVPARIRGIWKRVEDGVRETAETSEDGGKTWKPLFDLVFRRHLP